MKLPDLLFFDGFKREGGEEEEERVENISDCESEEYLTQKKRGKWTVEQ